MDSLIVVSADKNQQRRLTSFFSLDGYAVSTATTIESARDLTEKNIFDVAVIDIEKKMDIEDLKTFLTENLEMMTILVHNEDFTSMAVSLVHRQGGFDSLIKPYKLGSLYNRVEKAVRFKRLNLETQNLRGSRDLIYWSGDLIGHDPGFQEILRQVNKVAKSDSSILLLGESGTGKEVIAGVVHYNSLRRNNAFVKVNCAALHEELLETELFGHEKGAFTGAINGRQGRFEQANGGTIFLDEIGDMSLRTQAKVLRVLQEREFERVGSNRTIKVDVRILSATNKNIEKEIAASRFREDLYYRLNVVSLHIPPLRERKTDIMPLAKHFLNKFSSSMNRKIQGFEHTAEVILNHHNWPGNIRELKNCIERAVLFADNEFVSVEDLGLGKVKKIKEAVEISPTLDIQFPESGINLEEVERSLVMHALESSGWIQKKAAGLLNISPRVLNYKIKRFEITHKKWSVNSSETINTDM